MANYKVVDSHRLDADLTTVADAIRAKSGASAALAFPEGFVASVSKIPTGSGTELPELKDPGSAEDLVWGKEMIDGDGNVVTGKFELLPADFAENVFLYAPNVGEREANGSKRIYFNTFLAGRIGYEAGVPIQLEAATANFGNAKPEDVIYGATFTSAEGLNVSGTIPFLPAGQRASIGLAEEASRIDYGQYPVVRATAPIRVRLAMEAESSAQVDIPFWRLPGAEPNLLAENIRKGVSIFDVIGTFEGSGGGSGVISAVAAGTYTPASDSSTSVEIEHGLGVTPNFCIWMAENDFSDITDVSAVVVGAMVAKPMLHSVSSGMTYPCQYFLRGYNVSGLSNGTASYKSDGCMTDTIVTILGSSTYKLKSGWTYRWICGVADSFA